MRNGRTLFFCGWAMASVLNAEALTIHRYSWDAVKNAKYYQGQTNEGAGPSQFRTSGLRILSRNALTVQVSAYSAKRKILKKNLPVADAAITVHIEAGKVVSADGLSSPEQREIEAFIRRLDAETLNSGSDKRPEPLIIYQEDVHEEREVTHFRLAGAAALGLQSMTSRGGVTQFTGSGAIAGGDFRLYWDQALKASEVKNRPWGIEFSNSMHVFSTEIDEQNTVTSSESSSINNHYITNTRIMALFKDRQGDMELAWRMGVGIFRVPMIQLRDEVTGLGQFDTLFAFGPRFGVQYGRASEESSSWLIYTDVMPMTPVKVQRGWQLEVGEQSFFPIGNELFWHAGGHLVFEQAAASLECPAVADCTNGSMTQTQYLLLYAGVGTHF